MKDDRLTVLVSPTNQIKNWWCCGDESPVDRLTRVFSVLGNHTPLPTKHNADTAASSPLQTSTNYMLAVMQPPSPPTPRTGSDHYHSFPKPSVGAAGTKTTDNMRPVSCERFAKCLQTVNTGELLTTGFNFQSPPNVSSHFSPHQ